MLQYPSIPGSKIAYQHVGKSIIAQYKYDGSSLRWEWSQKRGWHKFGTRHQLFDATSEIYGPAIPLFLNGLAIPIQQEVLARNPKCERITAFTEFLGKNSFAGSHTDEPKELKLLDVFLFKKGFIPPETFVKMFGHQPFAPEIIYEGEITPEFIQDVRTGELSKNLNEGVVCKGDDFMVKIKTQVYLDKLKAHFQERWHLYAE